MARKGGSLDRWKKAGQSTISDPSSLSSLGKRLYSAAGNGEVVKIIYNGGTSAGSTRNITPVQLFRKSQFGGLYVTAYCHARNEERTFRLDRIKIPTSTKVTPGSSSNTGERRPHLTKSRGGGCFTVLLLFVVFVIVRGIL